MNYEKIVYETALEMKDKDNLCLISDIIKEIGIGHDELKEAIIELERKGLIKRTSIDDILIL